MMIRYYEHEMVFIYMISGDNTGIGGSHVKITQRKVVEVKLKLLGFSPVLSVKQKVQKVKIINIKSD